MKIESPFYIPSEAAKSLRVDEAQLKEWRQFGGGPPWYQLGPRTIRYKISDIKKFRARRKHRSDK